METCFYLSTGCVFSPADDIAGNFLSPSQEEGGSVHLALPKEKCITSRLLSSVYVYEYFWYNSWSKRRRPQTICCSRSKKEQSIIVSSHIFLSSRKMTRVEIVTRHFHRQFQRKFSLQFRFLATAPKIWKSLLLNGLLIFLTAGLRPSSFNFTARFLTFKVLWNGQVLIEKDLTIEGGLCVHYCVSLLLYLYIVSCFRS